MKVLIVDDERGTRVNVRHLLREQGLTDCLEADGGERAVVATITKPGGGPPVVRTFNVHVVRGDHAD